MKRIIPIVALGLGLLCADLSAQGRSFAGSWTLDPERTMAANAGQAGARSGGGGFRSGGGGATAAPIPQGGAGGRGGGGGMRSGGPAGPMTIALEADTFSVSSGTNVTTYRLDGSPTTTETPGGQVIANLGGAGRVAI